MTPHGSFLKHQSVRCQCHVSSQDQREIRQGRQKGGVHIGGKGRGDIARQEQDYAHQETEGRIVHSTI